MTLEEIKKTGDKKAILKYRTQCAKDSVKEYREQMRDATPEERKSIDKYIKSISKPTGIEFDEEQEQLDFVQPHKQIPVTLTIEGDAISREAVLDMLEDINAETEGVGFYYEHYVDYIKALPSVKPQESSRDMEEIEEIINCDADAETKCKMISNILTAKPHYFEKQEPAYCDRNICLRNEYNGIGCDECEVTKSQEPKTGHWIADIDRWGDVITTVNGYRCDKCNAFDSDKDNYCPNCGAKMD